MGKHAGQQDPQDKAKEEAKQKAQSADLAQAMRIKAKIQASRK
jgi:hypothetical protein